MSFLIKDVKAPRDCASCKMPMEICSLWVGTEPGIKHRDCPIVELPEKHGRLIDADAFDERARIAGGMADEELSDDFKDGIQTTLLLLKSQRTIIPAEPEEET